MKIDFPEAQQSAQIRRIWVEAFGEAAFWEQFFQRVYSSDHCRCLNVENHTAAVLFWFDCRWEEKKIAYLYAVATAESFRHRGLCRELLTNTHQFLREQGYSGTMLVPENDALRQMYRKMGYEDCGGIREFACKASAAATEIREINREEYARIREENLPAHGVIQSGNHLRYLDTFARMWVGQDFLLVGNIQEHRLNVWELLGNADRAPEILTALSCTEGSFRIPGTEKAFAMWRPLEENTGTPGYFGLAFD